MADKYPGWNLYHYVHNNPVRLIDPDGMEAEWIEDGDGKWKAEKGDGAETLARDAGISKKEAYQIMEAQGHGTYVDENDGITKSKINPGEVVDISSSECMQVDKEAKNIEIQQIGKRLVKNIAEDSKLAKKENKLDSNISMTLKDTYGPFAADRDPESGGLGASIAMTRGILKDLRNKRSTVIKRRDSIKDLIKKRLDSINQKLSRQNN